MMKGIALIVLLAWLLPAGAQTLRLYTEEYPPVSFSQDGQPAGMSVELVQELLRRLDQSATLQVVPWARAYHLAQTTPHTAIFPTIRNNEREKHFKWVGPIMLASDNFYALKGSGIVVTDASQLARFKTIALPRDWFTYQELTAAGMDNLLGVTEPAQMFNLLKNGRVPLIAADNLSFYAGGQQADQVAQLGADDVEIAFAYRQSFGYITFWAGTEDEVIQRWQQALDEMKADGSFSRIYQRWLPGAQEPGLREPGQPLTP